MKQGRFLGLAGLLALALSGCGGPQRYVLEGTGNAVGADARVEARSRKKTFTTALDMKVTNLPPPERLDPGATLYVVWHRSGPAFQWSRLGVLDYDADSRKGALEGVSVPHLAFDLKVTAELDPEAGAPSSVVVFAQHLQEP